MSPAHGGGAPAEERPARRASGARINGLLATVFVLAIAGMVNYLSFRSFRRWDWTSAGYFTLSERAIEELHALDEDVDLHLFVAEGEPKYAELRELLERCAAESEHFRVQYVDPDRNAADYNMLVDRLGLRESAADLVEVAAVLTTSSAERKWTITRDDLIGMDFGTGEEEARVDLKAEQAILGALVDVTNRDPTKICFSVGHGEWTTDPGTDRSLAALETELRIENVEMSPLASMRTEIPATCDAVFVIGPQRPLAAEEADRLGAYIRHGGSALLAIDPIIEGDHFVDTGLGPMLGGFGVELPPAIVLEVDRTKLRPPGNPMGPFDVDRWSDDDLVAPLAGPPDVGGMDLVVALARPVGASAGSAAKTLVRTSDEAWGETDLASLQGGIAPEAGADDLVGPLALAVSATRRGATGGEHAGGEESEQADEGRGRLVVVGDADWLQGDALRDLSVANRTFARFVTGWLTRRHTLISLPPKTMSAVSMKLREADLGGLRFRLLVLIPGAMMLLGVSMWWSRRS